VIRASAFEQATRDLRFAGEVPLFSITYQTSPRDRPFPRSDSALCRRFARGWLTAGGQTIPGRAWAWRIRANKREGDGGTPRASSGPGSCGGAPTANPRPRTFLPVRASGPKTPGAKILRAAITIQPCGWIGSRRRPAQARRSSLRFYRGDRSQQLARIAGRGSAVFLLWRARIFLRPRGAFQ